MSKTKAIESVKEAIEWFRVDGKPPDDEITVLVKTDYGRVFEAYLDGGIWRDIESMRVHGKIVWWADLPKGPPV